MHSPKRLMRSVDDIRVVRGIVGISTAHPAAFCNSDRQRVAPSWRIVSMARNGFTRNYCIMQCSQHNVMLLGSNYASSLTSLSPTFRSRG